MPNKYTPSQVRALFAKYSKRKAKKLVHEGGTRPEPKKGYKRGKHS